VRWFGHVQHRLISAPVRKSGSIVVNEATETRGRLKCIECN